MSTLYYTLWTLHTTLHEHLTVNIRSTAYHTWWDCRTHIWAPHTAQNEHVTLHLMNAAYLTSCVCFILHLISTLHYAPHSTHHETAWYTSEHHILHIWAPHPTHLSTTSYTSPTLHTMGWLRLVGSIKLQVSLAKEPYKRDYVLQKRPVMLSVLLAVATPYRVATIHSMP